MSKTGRLAIAFILLASVVSFVGIQLNQLHDMPAQQAIDYGRIRDRFDREGVVKEVQDRLIEKLKNGEQWDSQLGMPPLKTETRTEARQQVTVRTYPDGSEIIDRMQTPSSPTRADGGVSLVSVDSCRKGSGAGNFPFYDCKVSTEQFMLSLSFVCDGMTSSMGQAKVSNYRDIEYWVGAATVTSKDFVLVREQQDGDREAAVAAKLYVNYLADSGSGVVSLTFHVKGDSMWDTSP